MIYLKKETKLYKYITENLHHVKIFEKFPAQ